MNRRIIHNRFVDLSWPWDSLKAKRFHEIVIQLRYVRLCFIYGLFNCIHNFALYHSGLARQKNPIYYDKTD